MPEITSEQASQRSQDVTVCRPAWSLLILVRLGLLHHCEVISINGPSYRLKNRLKTIECVHQVAQQLGAFARKSL